jgi:two-component sensor histidine kinase
MPRLLASLIGLITLVSLVFAASLLLVEQGRLERQLEGAAEVAADQLARTLAFPIWNAIVREVDAQIVSAMLDPSLYGVGLTMDGLVPPSRAWSRDSQWRPALAPLEESPELFAVRKNIEFEGNRIGTVRMLFTKKYIRRAAGREAGLLLILVCADAAALAIGFYAIMRRAIIHPLRGIERWAAVVNSGKAAAIPSPAGERGEIASLKASIDGMVRLLGERYDSIAAKERELRAALAQKEALVHELYHRTRNSLQVLSGFISLRMGRGSDSPPHADLEAMQGRIQAISLAHEELFKSADLSYLDLGSYLRGLIERAIQDGARPGRSILFRSEPSSLPVLIDVALPVGFAVSELVANSLAFAFRGRDSGTIGLELERLPAGYLSVSVSDDGEGPPPGFDPRADAGFGLLAVSALIEQQLRGEVEYELERGFRCTMRFAEAGTGFDRRV